MATHDQDFDSGRAVTSREEFQVLVSRLHAARQFQKVYPPGHPSVQEAVESCFRNVEAMLQASPQLQIAYADGEFIIGSQQLIPSAEAVREFASTLEELEVGRLIIRSGLRRWELQRFLQMLTLDAEEIRRRGGIRRALANEGVQHIEAGPLASVERGGGNGSFASEVLFRAWEAYTYGLTAVRALRLQARHEGRLGNTDDLRQFAYELVRLSTLETRPLLAAQVLKTHDEYSFTHSVNVSMLTVALARALPFAEEQMQEIAVAALLHDIGKERIPREILQKPGKLTPEEWAVVNRHGVEGAAMLAATPGLGDLAPIVAFEHHLAYHSELPDHGHWQTHLVSQLVSLADVYDALRSVRPYRDELPPDVAMQIIEEDVGVKFDPLLFQGFVRHLGYYPPGTCLRLRSGAIAVSHAADPLDPRLPQVLVVREEDGTPVDPPRPLVLTELRQDEADLSVDKVVAPDEVGLEPLDYL